MAAKTDDKPDLIVRGALAPGGKDRVDLVCAKGRVLALEPYREDAFYGGGKVLDAKGLTLLPSLIDCHAHLREPGQEWKEDIQSGLEAAAHGGFGAVLCMANTKPVNDEATVTEFMLDQAAKAWPKGPRLAPVGALTKGLEGRMLAPMAELAKTGCVAFSNDGVPVEDALVFRRALEYAADLGKTVIDHCEDPHLGRGAMNEGELSGRLGLSAQPAVAEALQVARDCLLAEHLGVPVHLAHISCRESLDLIRRAKERGAAVTAETCPHYLFFTEDRVTGYDTSAKVNPPLRRQEDVEALKAALADGTIDILATDHAPHAAHEKETTFDDAPFGISGLDTALALTWRLVDQGVLTPERFIEAWAHAPARIFGLPVNRFQPGDPADFLLFDPLAEWTVTPQTMRSKGKNTPCQGMTLSGRVAAHYLAGKKIV